MRKLVLEVLTATALTLGSILASTPGVLANDVMVNGAFARASAMPTAKTGAVYMTLKNGRSTGERLLSATAFCASSTPSAMSTLRSPESPA